MSRPALWELEKVSLGRRLRDVSVSVERGVTAVLGYSGAGKTSLLNLLVGFERPARGRMTVGFDNGTHRRPLFWVPQDEGLWPHLTAREHIEAVGGARADEWIRTFDLAERADALPRVLSLGERARLTVARALAADAAVLVMDEPLAHVDPARVGRYWRAVRRYVEETGASLVFATHRPENVLGEAGRVLCMRDGAVIYAGAVEELYWRPGTAELATCLGEANWLEPAGARLWLQREEPVARCFRPEQVRVRPVVDGAAMVVESFFRGAVAEVRLRHTVAGVEQVFWHRPEGNHLSVGVRVQVEGV